MQLSTEGLDLIKRFEGFRSQVYLDVAGFPTIGYGHRLLPHESFPSGIDDTQATAILAGDVRQAEQAVERLVNVALSQPQFDALTDFCFNLGAGRLAASTLLMELNAGSYSAAGEQLLHWDRSAGTVSAGLKARRKSEFALWNRQPEATQTEAA